MFIKCISLGQINKYMFLVLLDSIIYDCLGYFEWKSKISQEESSHPIIYQIIYSFGLCLSISLLLIKKTFSKRKTNTIISQENNPYLYNLTKIKRVSKKEKILWILLVSFIDFIVFFINLKVGKTKIFIISLIFGVLSLSLFSYKILRYKLFKHHYLSIIIISISFLIGLIMIFILEKNKLIDNLILAALCIVSTTLYSLELTIDKYLIFSKYINSFEILFFQGIIELIIGVISLTITTKYDFIDNFLDYYNEIDNNEFIFLILLIIFNFIYYSLVISIIDIFSPFFILFIPLLSITIILIASIFGISFNFNYTTIYLIIIFILDFIMLLIFTEIIELNCFGLSYMTKRNIELRAQLDSITEGDEIVRTDTEIGVQGYIIELNSVKEEEKLMSNNNEYSKED